MCNTIHNLILTYFYTYAHTLMSSTHTLHTIHTHIEHTACIRYYDMHSPPDILVLEHARVEVVNLSCDIQDIANTTCEQTNTIRT